MWCSWCCWQQGVHLLQFWFWTSRSWLCKSSCGCNLRHMIRFRVTGSISIKMTRPADMTTGHLLHMTRKKLPQSMCPSVGWCLNRQEWGTDWHPNVMGICLTIYSVEICHGSLSSRSLRLCRIDTIWLIWKLIQIWRYFPRWFVSIYQLNPLSSEYQSNLPQRLRSISSGLNKTNITPAIVALNELTH